jgi:hypothetical protein
MDFADQKWVSRSALFSAISLFDVDQTNKSPAVERDSQPRLLKPPFFVVHRFRTAYTNDHDIKADAKRLHHFASLLVQTNLRPDDHKM